MMKSSKASPANLTGSSKASSSTPLQGQSVSGASSPSNISDASQHKVAASKAFLENHYRDLLQEARQGGPRAVGPREREPTVDDFELLKCIGRGAFGEVYVCQRKHDSSGKLYALKRLRKTDMIRKKQVTHVRSEKDVLSKAAASNPWVVQLYMSFQDNNYLYMVMEYMPGGDMISWLCEKGIFDVEATRFYIAELCAAVASVHAMYFVHRDIKPDNILFGADGHIKLSDFGLSKRFAKGQKEILLFERDGSSEIDDATPPPQQQQQQARQDGAAPSAEAASGPSTTDASAAPQVERNRQLFQSIVGSPGYIAPEILLRQPYGVNCDWWSVGVIMYEMLYGIPPFYSQDPSETCQRITHWRRYLRFPSGRGIPEDAVEFMRKLMCDPADRIGYAQIRADPFFASLDFDRLREIPAVYKPTLAHTLDTKYFPEIDGRQLNARPADDRSVSDVDPRGVMFADFHFNYNSRRYREQMLAGVASVQ